MRNKMIWGVSVFLLLVVSATVWFVLHNTAEIAEMEQESAALLSESTSSVRQTPSSVSGSSYQPPPPGETDGTGYWDGNTWHKTAPPKPPKTPWWKEASDNDLYSRALRGDILETSELREVFRYYPESPMVLSMLADDELAMGLDNPENAVMYAKKALRFLKTTSEDYSQLGRSIMDSPRTNAHFVLIDIIMI